MSVDEPLGTRVRPTPHGADLFRLHGRTAIVTGASGWLGRSITTALAEAGAHVVAVSRTKAKLDQVVDPLVAVGHTVEAIACDVTSQAWPKLVAEVGRRDAGLDILVNNAHLVREGASVRLSEPGDYVEALNHAVVAVTEAVNAGREGFARCVEAGGSPSVINIASMYGIVAPDFRLYPTEQQRNPPHYGVAKAGMLQLTRYLAAELGPVGVRVNAIAPGPFPQHPDQMAPEFLKALADKTLVGRYGRPDDLRTALLFLASPWSGFVTGSTVNVDGGWTAV